MTNLPRERPRHKPRPLKIEGVTVRPKWAWSKGYEKHVRESARALSSPHHPSTICATPKERHEHRAGAYACWLAGRDAVNLSGANKTECVWEHREYGKPTVRTYPGLRRKTRATFIRAVRFYYQAPGQHGQWYAGGRWKGDPIERELIATIEIPNHDFQPSVTEASAAETNERRAA